MRNMINGAMLAAVFSLALIGCATGPSKEELDLREAFKASHPKTILVVPSVNKSLFVEAPNYVLSSLSVPIANRGYYVFPANTVKVVLEQEGYYEPEKIQDMPTPKLASLFGADAVLYITILQWTAKYLLLSTTVTVEFDYKIVDKSGTLIWKAHKHMDYTPKSSSGNGLFSLIADVVVATATRAAPNYMPLVNQANTAVFIDDSTALPNGPYIK